MFMNDVNINTRENVFRGMRDVGQAESILNQYRRDHPSDLSGVEGLLNDLLDALFEDNHELFGDADDFHNFAVSVSRLFQDNQKAVTIVKIGLNVHPMNTDLLADAIKYGYNCGERESCKQWYQTLQSIDKSRWSWRAFSFSKDYLMDEWTSNTENNYSIDDVLKLVKEYQQYLPDEEDAWQCEFEVYRTTNRMGDGIRILEKAIERFRFCPKCWLRYADIMMERGEYEKAEPIIRKMCRNPKSGMSINSAYMYFLDGQCKLTKLYDSDEYELFEDREADNDTALKVEKAVWGIYNAFHKSLISSDLRENIRSQIDEYIAQLGADTHIMFPSEWRR